MTKRIKLGRVPKSHMRTLKNPLRRYSRQEQVQGAGRTQGASDSFGPSHVVTTAKRFFWGVKRSYNGWRNR